VKIMIEEYPSSMPVPPRELSIGSPADAKAEPTRTTGPGRPSRLGIVLAGCLLAGLFLWRQAVPDATPWLDLAALTAAWVFLLTIRTLRQK
jgi:hypothetical protein